MGNKNLLLKRIDNILNQNGHNLFFKISILHLVYFDQFRSNLQWELFT